MSSMQMVFENEKLKKKLRDFDMTLLSGISRCGVVAVHFKNIFYLEIN
jgi:hypothetical protein